MEENKIILSTDRYNVILNQLLETEKNDEQLYGD